MLYIICDLDGTIIDTKKRMDEVEKKYGIDNWPKEAIEEFCLPNKIMSDKTIQKGVNIISKLISRFNPIVYFVTGRSEMAREHTLAWLNQNLWKISNDQLLMRGNNEPDQKPEKIKENHLKSLNINNHMVLFFDDDPNCIATYSKYGLSFKAPDCWDYMYIKKLIGRN